MNKKEQIKDKLDRNIWKKQRINFHREYIESLLEKAEEVSDWDAVIKDHLVKISQFQHERLVHLIVTVTFALLEMITLVAALALYNKMLFILACLLLLLLIPYIMYYYMLENNTQAMYELYDRMVVHNNTMKKNS